MTAVPLS